MNNDLEKLGKKINQIQQSRKDKKESRNKSEQNGKNATRSSSAFLSYPIAGFFLGFMLDKYIGTAPFGIIIMLILGLVAGVYQANQTQNKK